MRWTADMANMDTPSWIKEFHRDASEIRASQSAIHDAVLRASPYLKTANFKAIHPSDLERLFARYDEQFFDGRLAAQIGERPLNFVLSRRMTSAAGKTTQFRLVRGPTRPVRFEIGISTTLLFQNFREPDATLSVTGFQCADRLTALQRVFEHELIHLLEMLTWSQSSCSKVRFQRLSQRFFLHTERTHRLITPREQAYREFGLRRGDRVHFRLDGRDYEGVINRITKRATVLVEDPQGRPYTDGRSYSKFYVPVKLLRRA